MKTIPLTRGYVAIIDDCDFERVNALRWAVVTTGGKVRAQHYWRDGGRVCAIGLARFIMGDPTGLVVDHIDHNPLNNCRANLRVCTAAQNQLNKRKFKNNTTGFKGVFRQTGRPGFFARICVGGANHYLGGFYSAADAAEAYDEAAVELHGEFAHLNFPQNRRRLQAEAA